MWIENLRFSKSFTKLEEKVKVNPFWAKLAHTARAWSFHNMKQTRSIATPPGWDASPLQVTPSILLGYPKSLPVPIYSSWVERCTVSLIMRVKCLAQQHNTVTPARADPQSNALTIRPPYLHKARRKHYIPFKFQRIIVVSLEHDMMNLPLDATAMLMISAECLTGKSNSPVMEAPEPSFFLFTLNTLIVLPLAKAVINALKHNNSITINTTAPSTWTGWRMRPWRGRAAAEEETNFNQASCFC